ncbi:adenylyltransferase/cytidyltransferase family protein [Streptomyces sp. NPDC048172]|uniref:adenylyltransferase/cytidyltransferase family protein n=1 Tax=Streptomyces sp. NPDC048172 TaxID=3365505 RepID=UPI00371981C7
MQELRLEWWTPEEPQAAPVGAAVVTGVFDLLHVGHARFLGAVRERAVAAGLGGLIVGVEDDARTRAWKGPDRPVNSENERAELLAALRVVDAVCLVHGDPTVVDWQSYERALVPLRPGALAFTEGDPHADAKRRAAAELGAHVWEIPLVAGRSTTRLLSTTSAEPPAA